MPYIRRIEQEGRRGPITISMSDGGRILISAEGKVYINWYTPATIVSEGVSFPLDDQVKITLLALYGEMYNEGMIGSHPYVY